MFFKHNKFWDRKTVRLKPNSGGDFKKFESI